MIFTKDEGVGDWKSGKIRIGQSPTLGKTFFEFLGQENTKNVHSSLIRQCFSFPHDLDWKKGFLKFELDIHAAASKQKLLWVWTIMIFYPIQRSIPFHVLIFPMWICPVHVFTSVLVAFLNENAMNLILCLCFEIPTTFSFWHFCSTRSSTGNVQKFVNFCVCM